MQTSTNGTYTLNDFQSRQIAVLITLHNCLSYNGVSWKVLVVGLHTTRTSVQQQGVVHYKTFHKEEFPTCLSGLQTQQSTKYM